MKHRLIIRSPFGRSSNFLELMAPPVAGRSSPIRYVLPNDITFNVRFLEIFCKKHLTKCVFDGRLTSTT